jgi:hypothetical protein
MTNVGRGADRHGVDNVAEIFAQKTKLGGASRRAAIAETARELGISAKAVYQAVERSKLGDKPDEG